jgi:hypothetical protein
MRKRRILTGEANAVKIAANEIIVGGFVSVRSKALKYPLAIDDRSQTELVGDVHVQTVLRPR